MSQPIVSSPDPRPTQTPAPAPAATPAKQENGLLNLVFNIIIPVTILNKLSPRMGALNALILALAFPLVFGLFDLIKKKKWNWFSVLGFINVSVTGSLAVLGLGGVWFSIKEAFFPGIIGVFVWYSARTKNPFLKTFLINPHTLNIDRIQEQLKIHNKEEEFSSLVRKGTQLLSFSFFVSAALNYILAERIFLPLDPNLDAEMKSQILNQQIAQMTTWASAVILVPSMIILMGILWYLLKEIRILTGLATEEILKS